MTTRFHYSQASFQANVLSALGLTALVCFLVWIFAGLAGFRHVNMITLISGLIFFGFCSAAMIFRYLNRAVIVAVRPDGLFDARYSAQAVPWEMIKEIRLARTENEYRLSVALWPKSQKQQSSAPGWDLDMAPLDGNPQTLVDAVMQYRPIVASQDF